MKRRLLLLILCLFFSLSATGCVKVPVGGQWDFGGKKAPIFGGHTAGQDFYVSDRNLARLDVYLYPPALIKPKQPPQERRLSWRRLKGKSIKLSVYGLPGRERLAVSEMPVDRIRTAMMYTFAFKPIAESKRKRLYFELSAPALTPESAVPVRITGLNHYKQGAAYIGGRKRVNADLGFQAYIDMDSAMLIHSMAGRLAADPPFMAGWILLILLVLTATILAWRRDRLVT